MTVIPFLPPAHSFQDRGSDMIVKNGATYLMWDMGKGKTRTCIMAAKKLGIPVLVLAPLNAAAITWPNELTKWAPELSYVVLHGPNKEHRARICHTYDVVILNFEGLLWFYQMAVRKVIKLRKHFVIWDESSLLKDHTTKRWQIMNEASPLFSPYRVCLSGTPMPNSMADLWAQYHLLDEGKRLGSDFYSFRHKYFDYTGPPRYKTTIKPGADSVIISNVADITDRLGPDDYIKLPEVTHNDIHLRLPPSVRKLYDELEKEFMLELEAGVAVSNSSATASGKLRQFCQGALYLERPEGVPRGTPKEYEVIHDVKVAALKSLVDTAAGNPILAPIQFRFEKAMIDKAMKYDVPSISGATSASESRRLVEKWNQGDIPLLLVHPRSVAFSLNLQYGGHTVVWVALPWEMDLYEQLIRRLRRQGQAHKVTVHRFIIEDSVDLVLAESLKRKSLNQETLFEGVKRLRNRRK